MTSSPCDLSATDLAAAVRSGSISPAQSVEAHLDRIAALDAELNAFASVRGSAALQEAEALAQSPDLRFLPLAGVCVAVKDNIAVTGEMMRMGSNATSKAPSSADDEMVSRLRAAGAIIIGTTRMPELAIWPFTTSDAFGPTRNPFDRSRTPGGSTGGGAVAVATGMASLALGTDSGGSLRVPAACCSLVTLKVGAPFLPAPSPSWLGLTQYGPLARTVADLSLALDVLADLRKITPLAPPARALRILVSPRSPAPGVTVSPDVLAALNRTASALQAAGHTIVHSDPPYPIDIGFRFARRWLPGIAQSASGLPSSRLEPRTRKMARAGRTLELLHLAASQDENLARILLEYFRGSDLLVTPTLATSPPLLDAFAQHGWLRTSLAVGNWICTLPWNLTDFPAASVPAGLTEAGLPIGLQVVAPPGGEHAILSLMRQIEVLQPFPALPVH